MSRETSTTQDLEEMDSPLQLHDDLFEPNELDENFLEPEKSSARNRTRLLFRVTFVTSLLLIVLGVTVAIVLGITVPFTRHSWHSEPPQSYNPEDILDSVEFQIALNPKEEWTDRESSVTKWLASFNNASVYVHLNREDATESFYIEYHYKTEGRDRCNTPEDVKTRIRQDLQTRKTTADIKHAGDGKGDSCGLDFWPSEKYYHLSRQKCEEDTHPCFSKYTRATAVKFETEMKFPTCGDLADVFPSVFNPKYNANLPHRTGVANWWRLQWTGIAGDNMHYEVTFDIRYDIIYDFAYISTHDCEIMDGEWSLRFFTVGDDKWEVDVVDDLQTTFYKLVLEFDTYEDHVTCAEEFLSGESGKLGVRMQDHRSNIE